MMTTKYYDIIVFRVVEGKIHVFNLKKNSHTLNFTKNFFKQCFDKESGELRDRSRMEDQFGKVYRFRMFDYDDFNRPNDEDLLIGSFQIIGYQVTLTATIVITYTGKIHIGTHGGQRVT